MHFQLLSAQCGNELGLMISQRQSIQIVAPSVTVGPEFQRQIMPPFPHQFDTPFGGLGCTY